MKINPIIIQDSREQAPVSGWFRKHRWIVQALPVGDYGIVGFSDWNNPRFVVERKDLDDLVQSLTHDRERFVEKEVKKLRQFGFAAILVEAVEDEIKMKTYRSQASPSAILATIDAIIVRAGIHLLWCGSPEGVAARIERLVRMFARGIEKEWQVLAKQSMDGAPDLEGLEVPILDAIAEAEAARE